MSWLRYGWKLISRSDLCQPEERLEYVCVWALRKSQWLHIDFLSFPSHKLSPKQTPLTSSHTQGKKGMHPFSSKTSLHQHYKWSSTRAIDSFYTAFHWSPDRQGRFQVNSWNGRRRLPSLPLAPISETVCFPHFALVWVRQHSWRACLDLNCVLLMGTASRSFASSLS